MEQVRLLKGDNMELLKTLETNSIDSVVSDPPYGLSFMNKKWDYNVPSVELWKEVLRVLKPGGHVLSFGGTRTYHRMVVNMEDAGFEIRDSISYNYGSGFPKSHNVSKKIEQEIVNLIYNEYICIWKNKLGNVKIVDAKSKKNQTQVGNNIVKENFAHENVLQKIKDKQNYQHAIVVENNSIEVHHILNDNPIAQKNAEQYIIQQQDLVRCVEQLYEDQIVKLMSILIAELNARDLLNENLTNKIKVEEVLKTLNGNKKFSVLEIIPVLCVVLPKILKHTILNQSKIFQSLDTKLQMDYVFATNATITKSIMEHLILYTVNILKKRIDFTIESGHTALKPSMELICLARKPLSEKSIAENVLKHGTGGINIDDCRVKYTSESDGWGKRHNKELKEWNGGRSFTHKEQQLEQNDNGRFPANTILECICDEPHSNTECPCYILDKQSKGSSRFFYTAKVSMKERNMGLDEITNFHPTIKPVNLMTYLCRLITPPNGVVLDMYMGSGSTGISALLEGFNFIGMEMDEDYFNIAEARINNYEQYRQFKK